MIHYFALLVFGLLVAVGTVSAALVLVLDQPFYEPEPLLIPAWPAASPMIAWHGQLASADDGLASQGRLCCRNHS